MTHRTLLIVDDEAHLRSSLRRYFVARQFDIEEAQDCAEALGLFRRARPDAVIVDYGLPDGDGVSLMRRLKEIDGSVPVILLTGHGSIELAVRAIQEGADQFLTKPVEFAALLVLLDRIFEGQRDRKAQWADRARRKRLSPDPFVGSSDAIRRLEEEARRALGTASPVLILGETGSGKGVLASWLHANGARADEAFVDLNCAGLGGDFLQTELFGHEKGAFTGAVAAKPGLLEVAHRGTLFLDEIGDMDSAVQPKLLKVLEEKRFRRLGDIRERSVDVRLISATHHRLEESVQKGAFREDLFYRISGVPLHVPTLRERGEDVVVLARDFLERIGLDMGRPGLALGPRAERPLLAHPWPGNLRELRNTLERAVLWGDGVVTQETLERILGPARRTEGDRVADPGTGRRGIKSLRESERAHIIAAIEHEGGSVERAAAALGLSRSALYQKLNRHGIRRPGVQRHG